MVCQMKKLLVIDGNSILNRAFYGIRPLTTQDGIPTNAVYGMINIFHARLSDVKPDYAAVAFDLKAPTFRHKKYAEYKAGRHATPDDLLAQFPWAKKVCTAMGIRVIEKEGWEADDILGTLASRAEKAGAEAYILTGDRDSLQLISDTTTVLLATNTDTIRFDRTAFNDKYGVQPEVFVDVKALMGDSSDNIPGVPGVGEKTALKLISEFGTLDGLYEKFEDSGLTNGVKNKLRCGKESAYLSRFLARIDRDAPIDCSLEDISWNGYNKEELAPLLTRLEFRAFLNKLTDGASQPEREAKTAEIIESGSADALSKGKTYGAVIDGGSVWFSDGEKVYVIPFEAALGVFSDPDASLSLFDAKEVMHVLSRNGAKLNAKVFDAALAAYVINAQSNTSDVDALALAYLKRPVGGDPAARAAALADLYAALEPRLDDRERILYEKIELPLSYVLFEMEEEGFLIDRKGLESYSAVLETRAKELEAEIYGLCGMEFNINSPKQLGGVLFDPDKLGLPAFKKTKSGYSTSAEVLEKLRPYHPVIDKILEYRQLVKLNSTYAVGLTAVADGDDRVHTTFNQRVTATGRLSSTDPNLQNIPVRTELGREMRRFFTSKEGYLLVDADYSQIELRLLAAISGDEAMQNAFREGVDIHTMTASQVFGIFPEMVTPELRKRAKAVNFGIVYGIGDYSLAADIHVSRKEAAEYIKNYLATYPKIDAYLKGAIAHAKEKGYVTTLMGRKRFIPELASGKKTLQAFGERVAMNSPIQGTAADIIKLAMVNTDRALKDAGIDARLILQVHDELLVEASEECAEQARAILKKEMEHAYEMSVPLDVEINIGKTWFDAH